jgi:hypothetical protein
MLCSQDDVPLYEYRHTQNDPFWVFSLCDGIWDAILGEFCKHRQSIWTTKVVVRIMAGVRSWCSCRGLFKRLDILPDPCQYILLLMTFFVDNLGSFQTNSFVHGLNTRNKHHLHRPIAHLSCFQKYISHAAVKVFNILPTSISNLRHDTKKFKSALWKYLMTHCFLISE